MREVLWKVVNGLRVFYGVIFALAAVGGVIATAQSRQWEMLLAAGVLFLLSFLLLRKRKIKGAPDQTAPGSVLHETRVDAPLFSVATTSSMEVPDDVLRDMRRYYKKPQAIRDAEIMRESFCLAQNTTDIEVFTSRVELARKKALTLKQAQIAKCKGVASLHIGKTVDTVLESTQSLKIDFLFRTYEKETQSAMRLKTPRGQRNRLEKFLANLQKHEDDFLDAEQQYSEVLDMVHNMMPEIKKAGEV